MTGKGREARLSEFSYRDLSRVFVEPNIPEEILVEICNSVIDMMETHSYVSLKRSFSEEDGTIIIKFKEPPQ